MRSRTLLTPQGDGNSQTYEQLTNFLLGPAPSLPRKGTETKQAASARSLHPQTSRTLLTPQGDGNMIISNQPQAQCPKVPHPPYPARGRKQVLTPRASRIIIPSVPHPPYPARGRKLDAALVATDSDVIAVSRTLLTPQGDGNPVCHCSVVASVGSVPYPPYPARGRKPLTCCCSCSRRVLRPAPSLPRKGTETKR